MKIDGKQKKKKEKKETTSLRRSGVHFILMKPGEER